MVARVTLFRDLSGVTATEAHGTLADLAELIRRTEAATKAELPGVKLARFGDKRSVRGSLRHNGNVLSVTGVEIDYDAGDVSVDAVVAMLRGAGVQALVHTTPSHTDESPRWRVLAPFATPLPPDARGAMLGRVNGVLGGLAGAESWKLSQSYHFGTVAGRPPCRVVVVDGVEVDLLDGLDAGAVGLDVRKHQKRITEGETLGEWSPEALVQLIREHPCTVPLRSQENNYAVMVLYREWERLTGMRPGGRGSALYRVAITAGGFMARGWVDADWVVMTLMAAAGNCGLVATDGEMVVRRELYRGLVRGLAYPFPDLRK